MTIFFVHLLSLEFLNLFVVAGCVVGTVSRISAVGDLSNPTSVVVDTVGNMYIGDSTAHVIRKITSSGKLI